MKNNSVFKPDRPLPIAVSDETDVMPTPGTGLSVNNKEKIDFNLG